MAREINGAGRKVTGADSDERKEEVCLVHIRSSPGVGYETQASAASASICSIAPIRPTSHRTLMNSIIQCVGDAGGFGPEITSYRGHDNHRTDKTTCSPISIARPEQGGAMFDNLVSMMWRELRIEAKKTSTHRKSKVPSWL